MLGDLQESFTSLEQGSKSMMNQVQSLPKLKLPSTDWSMYHIGKEHGSSTDSEKVAALLIGLIEDYL